MFASLRVFFLASMVLLLEPGASQSFTTSATPTPLKTPELNLPNQTSNSSKIAYPKVSTSSLPPRITGSVEITSACSGYNSYVNSCIAKTANFTKHSAIMQAWCLCYTISQRSVLWRPQSFDSYIFACASQLSTTEPSLYQIFTSLNDFCSLVGDDRDGGYYGIPTTAQSSSSVRSEITGRPTNDDYATDVSSKGIPNMKRSQIIGISIGCSSAGLLATYAVWARYRKKQSEKSRSVTETREVTGLGEPKLDEEVLTVS